MQKRALALRDERETERRAFVDEMYKLQWKESCDDGRLLDSKAAITFVKDERVRQLEQKALIAEKLAHEDELLTREWHQRIRELETKEDEKEAFRRAMEKEIKSMLDSQVEMLHERKEALRARMVTDARDELAAWQAAKNLDDEKDRRNHELARARGMETRVFNQSRLHLRKQAADQVKAQDLLLLNFALDKEASEVAGELAKKHEEEETTKRYTEYLKAQMIKEAENTGVVEALRKAEEDKIWDKRDKEQQDRKDARANLWAKTDEGT